MGKEKYWIIGLFLFVVALYFKSLWYPFQFDDEITIVTNGSIRNINSLVDYAFPFKLSKRILAITLFWVSYSIDELNPISFRVFNLLFHLINGLLIYILINKLIGVLNFKARKGVLFFGVAIFLVHPIQTQAVVYITQQMAVIAFTFYLLSVITYIKLREYFIAYNKLSIGYILLLGTFIIIGALFKQTIFSIPLFLIGLEVVVFSRTKSSKYSKWLISIIAILLISLVTFLVLGGETAETIEISRLSYLTSEMFVVLKYIQLIFIPIGFSIDHDPKLISTILNLEFGLALIVHIGAIALALKVIKKSPLLSLGIMFFYIGLAIESTIFPIRDLMFEHRVYISMLGVSIIFVDLLSRISTKTVFIFSVAMVLSLSSVSFWRINAWRSVESLWLSAYNTSGVTARNSSNLGVEYLKNDDAVAAKKYLQEALKINPNHFEALNNMGLMLMREERFHEAIHYLNKSIAIYPKNKFALNNLGVCWEQRKAIGSAIQYYHKALNVDSNFVKALMNLAVLEEGRGNFNKALRLYSKVESVNSGIENLHFNKGNVYLSSKDNRNAMREFRQSIRKNENIVDCLMNMGIAEYYSGKIDSAIYFTRKAMVLSPDRKDIRQNITVFESVLNK